uniref:Uncharacterized protein n=1 Tax=viral metagenome TaxID=1070528 RepID=A0A6M3KPY2_9ZZZZ
MLYIGNDWAISADSLNFIVWRKTDKTHRMAREEAGERFMHAAYFGRMQHVVDWLIEQQVKKTELKDLQTVLDAINTARQDLQECLSGCLGKPRDLLKK